MKPSLTPCSLVKSSWNFLRSAITGAMFTSLNVVRIALVDCDCSRRSAIRARRRLIGTRCSGRSPRSWAAAGDATWGSDLVGAPVGITPAVDLTPPATAASTSPLVTRPSLPEPATAPTDRLLSASSLAAAGIATSPLLPPAAAGAAAGAGAAAAGAGAAAAGAAAAPATASVSILAISWSAMTVAPSPCTISVSKPAAGPGTSSTTLSVSISIRISSTATASPAFFFQVSMVASATDSDSWGTLTSTIAITILSVFVKC